MVIRLEDAMKLRTAADKAAIQRVEKTIDDLISTSFAGDNETLTTAVPQGVAYNRRVYKIIQEMYQKAGWNVTLRCGDRDGDYFEVKPYRPRPETERTDSAHLRDR